MEPPPLLEEREPPIRLALAVLAPIVLGGVAGILLGVAEALYLVVSLIAALGGLAAGFEHLGVASGVKRGLLGGLLFGAALLIAFELTGKEATIDLPEPEILLIVLTTVIGAGLGAAGGALRSRRS